jgi:hypothetical protein
MSLPLIGNEYKRINFLHKNYNSVNRYLIDKPSNTSKHSFNLQKLASDFSNLFLSTNNISKLSFSSSKNTFCTLKKLSTISIKNNSTIINEITNAKNISNRYNTVKSKNNLSYENNNITSIINNNIHNKTLRYIKKPFKLNISLLPNDDNKKVKINKDLIQQLDKKDNHIHYLKINNRNKFKSQKVLKNIDKILTKFKINNIISKQVRNRCTPYQNHNLLFNERVQNTLLNDKFINKEVKRHRQFRFGININIINQLRNYITDFEDISKDKKKLIEEDLLKSLNEKDVKLILSDIAYFKDVNKKIVNKLKNLKSFTLKDILNQEDEINNENKIKDKEKSLQNTKEEKEEEKENENENENESNDVEKSFDINNNKDLAFLKYEKRINKLINKDLNKRLKIISLKKKKDIDDNNINICKLNTRMTIGKQRMEKDGRCEEACYRSFFQDMGENMKRQYLLDNNSRRLCKEEFFQHRRKEKLQKEKEYSDFLINNLNNLKEIYDFK